MDFIRVKTWHIVISGYSQTEGGRHGCELLALGLRRHSDPQTFVGLRAWNDDFEALASHIEFASAVSSGGRGGRPRIVVYAYSWGVGNGAVSLAWALQKRRIAIDELIACDPVYRSTFADPVPLLGHLARGIGVLRKGDITLPPNIIRARSLIQANNTPAGCRLVKHPHGSTVIEPAIDLTWRGYRHNDMDESREWFAAAMPEQHGAAAAA